MSSIDISSTYFCGSNTQDIHYVACDPSSIETLYCNSCGTNKRNVKEYISYGHKTNICSHCKEYSDTTTWYDSDFTSSHNVNAPNKILCCNTCGTNKGNVKECISYGHKTNICSYCKEYSDTTSWYDSDFTPSGHLQRWYR